MLSHRPLTDRDIPLICAFPKDSRELFNIFPTAAFPLTPEVLRRRIRERHAPTVLLSGGVPAGFANIYQLEPGRVCSIGNLIVSPAIRRVGAGKYLVRVMIDIARTDYQIRNVNVSCFNDNIAGLLLYHELGFVPYAMEERIDPEGRAIVLINYNKKIN